MGSLADQRTPMNGSRVNSKSEKSSELERATESNPYDQLGRLVTLALERG